MNNIQNKIIMDKNYYAEFETDRWIRENFFPDFSYKGLMVEVGAGPTTFYSMSKHFRENGWRCIGVDPNPKFVKAHQLEGNEIYQYACADYEGKSIFTVIDTGWWASDVEGVSYSSLDIKYNMDPSYKQTQIEVEVIKLDSLLSQLKIDSIDFLSVDVEGWELEVMKGFSIDRYKPKVVILEDYEPKETKDYTKFMKELNYKLVKEIEYNRIFSRI